VAVAQELGELFEADAVLFGNLSREAHAARRVGHDAVRPVADSRISRRGDTVDAIGVGEQAGDRAVARGGGVDLVHAAGQLVQMGDVDGSRAEQPQAAHKTARQVESLEGARAREGFVEQDQTARGSAMKDGREPLRFERQ